MAELKCFGTLCTDVYLHDNATVSEVIKVSILNSMVELMITQRFDCYLYYFIVGCERRHNTISVF